MENKRKCVTFSKEVSIILEPENMSEDLLNSRINQLFQRQADHLRMERLIAPILSPTHRKRIYEKFYLTQFSGERNK